MLVAAATSGQKRVLPHATFSNAVELMRKYCIWDRPCYTTLPGVADVPSV